MANERTERPGTRNQTNCEFSRAWIRSRGIEPSITPPYGAGPSFPEQASAQGARHPNASRAAGAARRLAASGPRLCPPPPNPPRSESSGDRGIATALTPWLRESFR